MRKAHPSPDHARGATGSRLSGSRLSGSLTSDGEEGEERLPAGVRDVISCAVDPLEIAASLESHGYANAVVKAKFGHQDVFSFTEELYNSAGYRPAPSSDERRPRPGGLVDLAHGAVFAAPVLVFAGAGVASRDWLSWWAVPLSLVLGFSFSQGMGYVSYARLGRSEVPGPPAAWGILSALGASAAASAGAASLWGGGIASTLFTVGMCVFMTAASWLVIANREGLFILWLLPGATGSAVYLSGFPFPLSSVEVEVIVGGSVAVTVVTARWRLPRQWRRNAPLSRQEASPAALYFLHGLASGALIAAFGLIQQERPDKQWAAVATYPLVLSLGAMEWQLRTLQARTRRAMERHHDLRRFARAARAELARSLVLYLAAFSVLVGGVWEVERHVGVNLPLGTWATGVGLALTFFLAWVVAGWGRVDLVVLSWVGGLGAWAFWEGVSLVTPAVGRSIGSAGWALRPEFLLVASTATCYRSPSQCLRCAGLGTPFCTYEDARGSSARA